MSPLHSRARDVCLVVACGCAAVVILLAARVHGSSAHLTIDARGARLVGLHPGGIPLVPARAARAFQHLGNPLPFAVLVVAVAAVAAWFRDWLAVVCALVAPPLAEVLAEVVGKPLVGRHDAPGSPLAFPSGHTTAMAGIAAAVLLVAYRRWGVRSLVMASPVVALPVIMTLAVVRLQAHLLSDAVAGVLLGFGTVAGCAGLFSLAVGLRGGPRTSRTAIGPRPPAVAVQSVRTRPPGG